MKPMYQQVADAVIEIVNEETTGGYLHGKTLFAHPKIQALPFLRTANDLSQRLAEAEKAGALSRIHRTYQRQRYAYGAPLPKVAVKACATPEQAAAAVSRSALADEPLPAEKRESGAEEREACPNGECADRTQCWEPCGELGKSEKHVVVHEPHGIERLAKLIGTTIAQVMVEAMKAEFEHQMAASAEWAQEVVGKINKPVEQQKKTRRPRVLILGPWPGLFANIKQEFGDVFDLVLIGPDESLPQLQATARGCDHVLVMTSKISHKHTDALKAARAAYYEIGGGLSGFRDRLTKLFVEAPPATP